MNPTSCFSSYNSIEQFRTMMKDFKKAKQNPSFNIPDIVTFTGSVKLHGTNAGVCFNNKVGMFCQSRNNIINLTYDNQGFAFFVEKNKAKFEEFFKIISEKYNINLDENTISIYGEWCGERIQKGVALTQLPKCFCIFDIDNIRISRSRRLQPGTRRGIGFKNSQRYAWRIVSRYISKSIGITKYIDP